MPCEYVANVRFVLNAMLYLNNHCTLANQTGINEENFETVFHLSFLVNCCYDLSGFDSQG